MSILVGLLTGWSCLVGSGEAEEPCPLKALPDDELLLRRRQTARPKEILPPRQGQDSNVPEALFFLVHAWLPWRAALRVAKACVVGAAN